MRKIILLVFFIPSLSFAGELKLIGKALLEFSIFKIDVYEISYYKGKDGHEELVLNYKTDVKSNYSKEGWKEGLKHIIERNDTYKKKAQWLISNTVDFKEGDIFTIPKNKNLITLEKNKKVVANIDDQIIAEMVFEPWLGKYPVDEEVKKKLLGKLDV